MELFPELEFGWRNGWLLIILLYATYSILLKIFPKDVVARLYDRSERSKRHKILIFVGSILAFAYFGLIIFTPLKIISKVFIPGLVIFVLGLVGFVIALYNFKNAPLDKPAIDGLYRISRHPQQLMFFIAFIGICIAVGSWAALIVQLLSSIFLHQRVLAEEKACFKQYGEEYQKYKKRVPRYFLFF
jgi:protein-S-isoprenylcysteine O-methyltransferase Ste14